MGYMAEGYVLGEGEYGGGAPFDWDGGTLYGVPAVYPDPEKEIGLINTRVMDGKGLDMCMTSNLYPRETGHG